MTFAFGVVLFAAALLFSIAWHECGHMWAAQATGMKVRRYFVGFGPTIWSFRRGETEYGIKALPLGGFCDIAGMTPYEQLTDDERDRAMYKQKAWKRLVVLFAGPAQNFIFGLLMIYLLAVFNGLPDLRDEPVRVADVGCVALSTDADGRLLECAGTGPAQEAGILPGDQLVAVDGREVGSNSELIARTQRSLDTVTIDLIRDGQQMAIEMPVTQVERKSETADGSLKSIQVGAIGVTLERPQNTFKEFNALTAVPGTFVFTGQLLVEVWNGLLSLPTKIGDLWDAVTGGERDMDTPVSVYGASVMGGQTAERGAWTLFVMLLITVNFFLGVFNLVPLLPLDGGHMAIVGYEKGRNLVRKWLGRVPAGPVDYMKLMPLTYVVVVVMGGFMVLTLAADIINPIQIWD